MMRAIANAAAVALLLAGCSETSAEITAQPRASRLVDRSFFGLHVHWRDINAKMLIPPVGSLRLWDTRTNWSHIQPTPVSWDFSRLDRLVAMGRSIDAELVYTLGNTPKWAASRYDQPGHYGNDSASPPANTADWDTYVRTVVTRYRGRIKTYEILNEPKFTENSDCLNKKAFYCAPTRDVVALVDRTASLIKSIDPGARLLGPGLDSIEPAKQFAAAGGLKRIDAIAFHFYAPAKGPTLADKLRGVRAVAAAAGRPTMPIWNTEAGYPFFAAGGNNGTGAKVEASDGPGAVSRQLVTLAAEGIGRSYYYAWDDAVYGLGGANGAAPSKAGDAYLTTMSWLVGARISPCVEAAGIWRCNLSRGATKAVIAWAESSHGTLSDAGVSETRFVQPLNGAYDIAQPGQPIRLSAEPTLIVFGTPRWGQPLSYITAPR